ncbi:MAG: POTRA domain-containing protein [Myxococcota bacterium]
MLVAVTARAPEPPPAEEEPPEAPARTPATVEDRAPLPAEPEPPGPCVGRRVASVALVGCRGRTCDTESRRRRLLSLADLDPEETLTAEDHERAVARLEKTGYFREVAITCEQATDGVDVRIVVDMNTFVRDVDIEGNEDFRVGEIRKRLFLRSGTVLNVTPGEEEQHESVRRQVQSLQRFYRREGLEDVSIGVEATRADPTTVDLRILIDEGERRRIRDLVIRHRQVLPTPPGEQGCPTVSRPRLRRLVGVGVGGVVTSRTERRVRRDLETFFQSIGYVRPHVDVRVEEDPLRMVVDIQTERCWLVRVWERESAAVSGTRDVPAFRFHDPLGEDVAAGEDAPYQRASLEPWREKLPFGPSGVFDREEAKRGVEIIQRDLEDEGFPFAEVVLEHRRFPRAGPDELASPVAGAIDFRITRNYERRIQGILLPGRRTFSEERLLEEIDTKVYDALGDGGFVQVEQVLFDLKELRRFYEARGFYRFRFLVQGEPDDPAPSRERIETRDWLVWEYRYRDRGFRVKKRRSEMVLYLELPFEEGPRTRLQDVVIAGNEQLSTRRVGKMLGLAPGDPFGSAYLEDGLQRIRAWYRRRGFHQARVRASCEADIPPPGGDCSLVRSSWADLIVSIDEGPRSVVGEIFWRGNFRTDPEVLVRDLPESGEPYDQSRLAEATRKLRNLGVFSAVDITRIGLEESPPRERIALVVSVEEADSRFLDLAAGFRTIDRDSDRGTRAPPLLGSIVGHGTASMDRSTTGLARAFPLSLPDVLFVFETEYIDRHFRGMGHRMRLPVKYGFSTKDALRLLSFVPTLDVPRFLGSDILLQFKLLAELDRVNEQLDREEVGAGTSLTWPLRKRMSLGVGVEASYIRFTNPDESPGLTTRIDDSFVPQVRPSVRWRWDTQDNPLHPTEGFALTSEVRYILAVDRQVVEDERRTEVNNFVKWQTSFEWAWKPRGGPVVAWFSRYGAALGAAGELLPPNERFTLGGSNGLRGFADHAVGRYDENGRLEPDITDSRELGGGNVVLNGSVEFRLPILEDAGLWLGTFLDGGALARTHDDLSPGSFRFSAGAGLRWLIGDQIPIRFDWAAAFGRRRCVEWREPPEPGTEGVCANREQGQAFHFDLLYPF